MEKINCLIVDDEELARTLIESYISKLDFLQSLGSVENAMDALGILRKEKIDLIFLDIQMPNIKGTDFARMIPPATQVIFTTAYSEYALDGFEVNALDYLLKPITFERFLIAVNRFKKTNPEEEYSKDYIVVKSGYDLHKIKYTDILFIVSDSEYVVFHTTTKKIMSHMAIKSLVKLLPLSQFMRVHRSYIINKQHVNSLKGKDLFIGNEVIPVSSSYFESVKKELF